MKNVTLASILAIVAIAAFGADIGTEFIDEAKITPLLPGGWIIKTVTVVESPTGWKRTKGSNGIQVSFANPTVTIHDQMVGDYHPMYSFTLVPLDWEGTTELGDSFVKGTLKHEPVNMELQVYPDEFKKTYPRFHYFGSILGRGAWKDPFKDLSRHFDKMK